MAFVGVSPRRHTIPLMADGTWRRLIQAAGLEDTPENRQVAQLAALLGDSIGETPNQTITNWRNRKVSAEGALAVQRKIGVDANWLLTGEGLMHVNWPFQRIKPETWAGLSPDDRAHIEGRLAEIIEGLRSRPRSSGIGRVVVTPAKPASRKSPRRA